MLLWKKELNALCWLWIYWLLLPYTPFSACSVLKDKALQAFLLYSEHSVKFLSVEGARGTLQGEGGLFSRFPCTVFCFFLLLLNDVQWCMCVGNSGVPRPRSPSVTLQHQPGLNDHHPVNLSASYPQFHPTCSVSPPTRITCLYPRRLFPACLATVDQLWLTQPSEAAILLLQWVLTSAWGTVSCLRYSPGACFTSV